MADVRVRPELEGDAGRVRDVVDAAFGPEPVGALLDALRASTAWIGLSHVAELGGEVVGHVSYTRGWVDDPERLVEVLVLSPLSVHPAHQGRGVGSRLVRESLALLEDRSEPLIFLEGAPGFYARFGFRPGRELGFEAPSVRIPPAAFQVLPRPLYDGSVRGALVYPDVFWAHDAVGLRDG